ncbi:MAG: pantoate--beta-alanine ligase [Spirochaetales bacterium]|nr:pantoate--beta-alanine ligase [Spirochaetales bacterium]
MNVKLIETIQEMLRFTKDAKHRNLSIGYVPTMGALHEGHVSLMKAAVAQNDIAVMTIFVNPIQFGPNEDYEKYPRTLEADLEKAEAAGILAVFFPSAHELTENIYSFVDINELQNNLCGVKRPGHFRGVCTIVSKFFNIIQPDNAYFGKKDIQQLYIIKQMVKDLNFPVNIVPCEIVRESDGLAMSSRNRYLSANERKDALIISQSIKKAITLQQNGETSPQIIINCVREEIAKVPSAKIDYISIVNEQMQDVDTVENKNILALAVYIGKTRLIDNHIIGEKLCF